MCVLLNIKFYRRLTEHMEIYFVEIPKFKLKDIRKMKAFETRIPFMKKVMNVERSFLMDKMQRREYKQKKSLEIITLI